MLVQWCVIPLAWFPPLRGGLGSENQAAIPPATATVNLFCEKHLLVMEKSITVIPNCSGSTC